MRGESLLAVILVAPVLTAAEALDYTSKVKPILAAKCFSCHGPKQQQSGLRLDLRQNALRGGDYGAVIVPGKSAESKLVLRLTGSTAGMQMPPTGALEPDEITTIRTWIDQGADMPGRNDDQIPKPKPPPQPRVQAFLDAIDHRDIVSVRAALAKDKGLALAADGSGSTALMHAAYAGTLSIMSLLLNAGADLNKSNDREATPLHWAAADPEKLKLLLAKGAKINAKTVEGRTTLYMAATLPAGAESVRVLLEGGADPNARTITGTTPLFPAVGVSLESTKLLLAKGADPNLKSETGATALMAAAPMGEGAVALLLARGVDANARTKRGETALLAAANRGNLASVKMLLEKGAQVNVTDYRGYTPLMHAAYCDNVQPELIRLLLAKGANVNATGEGETALSLAAKRGDTEVTRLLRQAQANTAAAQRTGGGR